MLVCLNVKTMLLAIFTPVADFVHVFTFLLCISTDTLYFIINEKNEELYKLKLNIFYIIKEDGALLSRVL